MSLEIKTQQNKFARPATRRLAGNTVWNLLGMCLPMLIALFAIPKLIHGLGTARFGLLGIVWMLVGYLSVFDLGLGRALTKMVSAELGKNFQTAQAKAPRLFWSAILLMLGLGVFVGLSVAALAPFLASQQNTIDLHSEVLKAFYIVALGLPVVIITTGLVGMLESYQLFRQINYVRIPAGSFTFLGPLCVLPFSNSLPVIVAVLIAGRLAETLAYFGFCLRCIPALRTKPRLEPAVLIPLMKFGGWLTVSTIIMPLMAQIDRLFIGKLVSAVAVGYYIAAAEVVIKLLVIPRAWVSVLFPAFSAQTAEDQTVNSDPSNTGALFGRGLRYLLGGLFPAALLLVAFAPEGLSLWLGQEYAAQSGVVMRLLSIGVFLNGLSFVPFSFLQGLGRPQLPAGLHLIELGSFLILLYFSTKYFGITGAAVAWLVRAGADLLALLWLSGYAAPAAKQHAVKILLPLFLALFGLSLVFCTQTFIGRLTAFFCVSGAFTLFYLTKVLTNQERATFFIQINAVARLCRFSLTKNKRT